jgi:hypothetical protein
VQLPVYESLTDDQINRVATVVVDALTPVSPPGAPTRAHSIRESHP